MPLLTFALAVHGEQAYLEGCAASLLEGHAADVELVVVDDASPDHAPRLLDELAARDERVRVEHLGERIGPGPARNRALELARGDFVWFVDATDTVKPGAVDTVARALATAPDVLLLHHEQADALGRTKPGPHRRLLERIADEGTATLDTRPGIAELAPNAWNKVFRRAHLEQTGARFQDNRYGDLTLIWPALLAAERIAASPAPAYVRSRPANATPEGGSPLDVFAASDAVMDFVGAHPELPEARTRLVAPALLRRQLALLPRVPAKHRSRYFAAMSEQRRRHKRDDEPQPKSRLARLRLERIERGDERGFRALEAAQHARQAVEARRRRAGRIKRRTLQRARNLELRRYYRARLKAPIDDDLAVFAAYWFRGCSCNPRAIYEAARELVPGMRGVWVVKRDAVDSLPPGVEHVIAGTREYYDVIARARYFVNNVNFPDHLVKRPGTVHVMTHHGTPLKTMGLDLQRHPVTGSRMNFPALMRRCRRWDFSVSANVFSTLIWERVYPTKYESIESGYPRNDVLARAGEAETAAARERLGIEPGKIAVLYAPTHREYQQGYVPVLDLAATADALGPDFVLLARLHYFHDTDPVLSDLHRQGRLRDVAAHPSIEELCVAADVLVTDYSSLMFDYAVLDRPIVIHAPDWETYAAVRGTYFDLMTEGPGPVTRTEDELTEVLRSRAAWEETARRAAFRERFCSLEDGHAAERVVRRVWLGEPVPAPQRTEPVAR